ncbi:hypothetical protein SLEP1_g5499 [Rubroshorea leprosula]|uniref:RRM domain-containing protein n=1 Tax=Rubroshorea leprosula TaxID=152421 RepID=A0AAV5HYG2_9ROSI|nr:hypothetical protein SLEP1_g5499 [Rubroshorea leprosula]
MAGKEDYRIFVGGLPWDITERQLEDAFIRFGKIFESQSRKKNSGMWFMEGATVNS